MRVMPASCCDVSVETGLSWLLDESDHSLRLQVSCLVSQAIFGSAIRLPITWTVEVDDRTIEVNGESRSFQGVRLVETDSWAGTAAVGDGLHVTIRTTGPMTPRAIVTCHNVAMPDRSPEQAQP